MKKLFLITFLVTSFCAAALVAATDSPADRVSAQLCDFWRYDSTVRGYVCTFRGLNADLVEYREYQSTVSDLERRIANLERQLRQLRGEK